VSRPNVLLLFTDDQRHDTIGALGNERVRTPHLDGLVARGTAFERCHIMGGTCGAVCMPSRAMLHTGRHLFSLHASGRSIPAEHVLLGEHLAAHGYACFGTGKWHNGAEAYARSFDDGGAIFFGGMADHWNVPFHGFDPSGAYDRQVGPRRGDHSTTVCADEAVRFLRRHDGERPFFCSVAFLAPHDPRTMPAEFLAPHRADPPPLPENFAEEHPFDNGELSVRDELLADLPRIPEQVRRHLGEYHAMIDHLDHAIGRILTALEERGLADDTIVILAGDNGLAVGQHGLMGKQSCYDHSVRVPLILAGPGVPAGARRDQLLYLHDLFPTLCELCDLPIPASVQSRSFAAALREDAPHRDELYLAYRHYMRAITDGRFKYIEYAVDGAHRRQLFDLGADPWETADLAGDPAHAARVEDCAARLARAGEGYRDREPDHGARFWSTARG